MNMHIEEKPKAFFEGYYDWKHCHCNNLPKPDNPYTEEMLGGDKTQYDLWEDGWIEASFGND